MSDKTAYLNVRLSQDELNALKAHTEAERTTVSDTIRGLLKTMQPQSSQAPQHEPEAVWSAFSELCKAHPQANPGDLLKLVMRVGIRQLEARPELVDKKLSDK